MNIQNNYHRILLIQKLMESGRDYKVHFPIEAIQICCLFDMILVLVSISAMRSYKPCHKFSTASYFINLPWNISSTFVTKVNYKINMIRTLEWKIYLHHHFCIVLNKIMSYFVNSKKQALLIKLPIIIPK